MKLLPALAVFLLLSTSSTWAEVTINELMYHPASENDADEYIELYNPSTIDVDLGGWRFTTGISFTFPSGVTISAGGYLVVAADPAVFHAKFPAVVNYVSGAAWSGHLSNSSDHLTLTDAAGNKRDEVSYADDGDWARRRRDTPDYGHRGWQWQSDADGLGKTLELINPLYDNSNGQNWTTSIGAEGTPGAINSTYAANIAPLISDVGHFPLVPKPTDTVTVTCRIADDHGATISAQLFWRIDGASTFQALSLFDDGNHGDALAGDGVFGGTLPAAESGTIVEFYLSASDGGLVRTWPAPALDYTGSPVQSQNCLYQVDDSLYAGAMPLYRLILRGVDKAELDNINTDTGAPPFGYSSGEAHDQTYSHAKFNATFVSVDGTGQSVRYLAGVRNRGNGSRSASPQSFNLSWQNGVPWNGLTGLNLNTQDTPYQLLGSALFRKSGLSMAETRPVQLRVNNTNPANSTAAPAYGFYVSNEEQNSEFTSHHFPLDPSGNLYRGQRVFRATTAGGTAIHGADLSLIAPAGGETQSLVDLYKLNYFKHTNSSEDQWTDLISLTQALAKGHSGATTAAAITYDADYVAAIQAKVDVNQWMRFMAVNTFADNSETNITMGDGDDFYLYFGVNSPKAQFVSYDLDTILGRSSGSNSATHGLFRMVTSDETSGPTPLNAFMKHPQFVPLYYGELVRLLQGPFSAAQFNPLVEATLNGVAPPALIRSVEVFNAARSTFIASQIPLALSATSGLTTVSGYPKATTATADLTGTANAVTTRSVKVNGKTAIWTAWTATWSAPAVTLTPGINRILIQALDAGGVETERLVYEVWYDDASVQSVSGTISTNSTWTPAGGPYQVTAALNIASGATLTIQPGTSVYLASGVSVTVASGGRILAEGTETQHIRFSRTPGATTNWGNLVINGAVGSPESRIAYADFEYNINSLTLPAILVAAGTVYLDHLTFANTVAPFLHLDGATFLVSNCIFPAPGASFEGVHGTGGVKSGGYGIVRDCFFGKANGYNDVLDFTGGNRPAPIIQFYNNVFVGGDDDGLDLDGTDAWIEGNIFLHFHRKGSPDSSSAVSGGNDSGSTSEITILHNLFFDVDQATTAKQGNFYTFLSNTVVNQSHLGSDDPVTGVFNLADAGIPEGLGMYVEGNIIANVELLTRNVTSSSVMMINNLLSLPWNGPGTGNSAVDPLLTYIPKIGETNFTTFQGAQIMRQWFALRPGSPGLASGLNGRDKGGVGSLGASLSGAPVGITNQTTANLTVGDRRTGNAIPAGANAFPNGSGFTAYQWRLDGGPWSAEIPIATTLSLSGLTNGTHHVDVIGRNDAGLYQNDPRLGTNAGLTSSPTWTVDTAYTPPPPQPLVQISEVLAKNTETLGFSGNYPDLLELFNAGTVAADLTGWGLTDNSSLPYKFSFPAGTTLAPGVRLVVYLSSSASVPAPKTGFALKDAGDSITLTRSPAAGGTAADSVSFGAQMPDYSIGRRPTDGSWDLCHPTFGAANIVAPQGSLGNVVINEWLADAAVLAGQDFIELYNPESLPVNIGNCYLTDNPNEWPQRQQLRQLTFLAPAGYASFKADDDTAQGADHLGFKLNPLQGEIGLFSPALGLIDNVVYGSQSTDVSQGRTPNGSSTRAFFTQPTPGGPNPGATGTTLSTVNVIPANQSWRYFASTAAPANDANGLPFNDPAFVDSAWASGPQLLYIETAALTNPEGFTKATAVAGLSATKPYQTYYLRTHFNWSGATSNVSLSGKTMVDDGCILCLNGQELVPSGGSRIGMAAGSVSYTTLSSRNVGDAAVETFTFPATALRNGDNVVAVEVHQSATQSGASASSDIVWGMKLDVTVTTTAGLAPIVLNEVLPLNVATANPDGSHTGWIELYNPNSTQLSLADASISDDPALPRKFVFPPGTSIPAGGFYLLYTAAGASSAANAGFALNGEGGTVLLFEPLGSGGGLRDSVSYGRQLADYSLGRSPNGTGVFSLCLPTPATANNPAGLASLTSIKINEWVTNPADGADFFELYNLASLPVSLGGNYLTDQLTNKVKHLIPPLTFIGGSGATRWQAWIADNVNAPAHTSFTLDDGEALGLYTAAGVALDSIALGTVPPSQSRGRYPDGTSAIMPLMPTAGGANQQAAADVDGDGIPDAWELANGFNPNDPTDALRDSDGDGQSNLAEYLASTNPHDATDSLRASLVIISGQPNIRFNAVAGKTYTVEFKNDLTATSWSLLASVPAQSSSGPVQISDSSTQGLTLRFYRVVTP